MKRIVLLLAALTVTSWTSLSAAGLSDAEFRKLHAELQPDNSALWRTVPWKISVLDGQQKAAEEKKPLFIWAMDGHPLGCT
jgi:hypothetical protein